MKAHESLHYVIPTLMPTCQRSQKLSTSKYEYVLRFLIKPKPSLECDLIFENFKFALENISEKMAKLLEQIANRRL